MKIVHEKLGKEEFIEILIDKKDIQHIKEYFILQQPFYLESRPLNVGIKLRVHEDFEDDD